MDKIKLTKTTVEQFHFQGVKTAQGAWSHDIRWDSEVRGFGFRLYPSGERTFIYRYRANGIRRYITLGRFPDITPDQARKEAKRLAGEVAQNNDPQQIKQDKKQQAKQDEVSGTTLGQAYAAYKSTRSLSEKTLRDYDRVMEVTLKDWLPLPLAKINATMVATRHKSLSPAYGGLTMRVLRAVYNYAMEQYTLDDGSYLVPEREATFVTTASPL